MSLLQSPSPSRLVGGREREGDTYISTFLVLHHHHFFFAFLFKGRTFWIFLLQPAFIFYLLSFFTIYIHPGVELVFKNISVETSRLNLVELISVFITGESLCLTCQE